MWDVENLGFEIKTIHLIHNKNRRYFRNTFVTNDARLLSI